MMQPIFISGIGTGVGKTLVAAIITEALQADYWKPVQAGYAQGTDSQWISEVISNPVTVIHPELYKLKLAASPHIAAREEAVEIRLELIAERLELLSSNAEYPRKGWLIMEGAGGLMVPLNDTEWTIDLIQRLDAAVILVSRNYLGSINHSLMTAEVCQSRNIKVLGWIFNDQYLDYESEIVNWTGIPSIASIPYTDRTDQRFVQQQAAALQPLLKRFL
jgi:dethiobiotin synthetase